MTNFDLVFYARFCHTLKYHVHVLFLLNSLYKYEKWIEKDLEEPLYMEDPLYIVVAPNQGGIDIQVSGLVIGTVQENAIGSKRVPEIVRQGERIQNVDSGIV